MRRSVLVFLVSLAACATSVPVRRGERRGAGRPSGPEIAQQTFRLRNGMEVVIHVDHRVPVVQVETWYRVGSADDPPGAAGLSHLLEHVLVAREARVGLHKVGEQGDYAGLTDTDHTLYKLEVPARQLGEALWVERERLRGVGLADAGLDEVLAQEKRRVLNERDQSYENVPLGHLWDIVAEALYPPGTAGHLGRWQPDEVNAVGVADLREFFGRHYFPANVVLVVAGHCEPAVTRALIEQYFGLLPSRSRAERAVAAARGPERPERLTVEADIPLPRERLVWRGAPAFSAAQASFDVLASALATHLWRRLVGELRVATWVTVEHGTSSLAGELTIDFTVAPGNTPAAVERLTLAELAAWPAQPSWLDGVERAKRRLQTSILADTQALSDRAERLLMYQAFGGDAGYLSQDLARYQSVTPADLARMAARLHAAGPRVAISVRPDPQAPLAGRVLGARAAPGPKKKPAIVTPWQAHAPTDIRTPRSVPDLPFRSTPMETFTLSNGLGVIVVPLPDVPIVESTLVIRAGYFSDPPGQAGLAGLTGATLHHKLNSQWLPETDEIEREGALIDGQMTRNLVYHSLTAMTDRFAAALRPWAGMIHHPSFDAIGLDSERRTFLEANSQLDGAGQLALHSFQRFYVGDGHPGSGPPRGTAKTLGRLGVPELQRFHESRYRPEAARLIVVGNVVVAELRKTVEAAFGEWRGSSPPVTRLLTPARASARTKIFLVPRPGAKQASLVVGGSGVDAGHPDFYPEWVANDLLRDSMWRQLVTNHGWSYNLTSTTYSDPAAPHWELAGEVQAERVGEAVAEVQRQLDALTTSGPKGSDLEAKKQELMTTEMARFRNPLDVAKASAYCSLLGLPFYDLDAVAARISDVGLPDIQRVAQERFRADRLTIVVVGDPAVVGPQLRKAGPVEIVAP